MEVVVARTGTTYSTSSVVLEPFINLDPGNLTTIYTALLFAQEQCRKQNEATCFVIFDQPLYVKALEMVELQEDMSDVIVRLDGFHLLTTYLRNLINVKLKLAPLTISVSLTPHILT